MKIVSGTCFSNRLIRKPLPTELPTEVRPLISLLNVRADEMVRGVSVNRSGNLSFKSLRCSSVSSSKESMMVSASCNRLSVQGYGDPHLGQNAGI